MKIWEGFGSEHSANLVMIGRFATAEDALLAAKELEALTELIEGAFDYDRFDEDPMALFRDQKLRENLAKLDIYSFSPEDIETLVREYGLSRSGVEVEIRTDELDVSGFLKFMIHKGARVEVYSAHNYPD